MRRRRLAAVGGHRAGAGGAGRGAARRPAREGRPRPPPVPGCGRHVGRGRRATGVARSEGFTAHAGYGGQGEFVQVGGEFRGAVRAVQRGNEQKTV
eukprot:876953-Prymnesium_polylepis.1